MLVFLVLLSGFGFAAQSHGQGRWCISSDVIVFGNKPVGSSTTSNATVTNCGVEAWSFTDVSVHSATGPAFHVTTTCATGMSLAPGQSCTITVLFAPLVTGQTSGALWLRNSTSTPTQLLTFYGRGIDAQAATATIVFTPSAATFGEQEIGKLSAAMTIELHNIGPASLTPTAMVLNGPQVYDFSGYAVTCQVGVAIPAGQSCVLSLSFKPQDTGTRRANLVIDAPQLASLAIMQISGVGTVTAPAEPQGAVAPTAIPAVDPAVLVVLGVVLAALGCSAARRRKS